MAKKSLAKVFMLPIPENADGISGSARFSWSPDFYSLIIVEARNDLLFVVASTYLNFDKRSTRLSMVFIAWRNPDFVTSLWDPDFFSDVFVMAMPRV